MNRRWLLPRSDCSPLRPRAGRASPESSPGVPQSVRRYPPLELRSTLGVRFSSAIWETNMRALKEVDLADYDFLDFGSNSGGSIEYCELHVGGRGLGIDNDPKVVSAAQAAGRDVVYGDITTLQARSIVRYVSMFDFLEHLPNYEVVRTMIGVAAAVAREFILIRHPSFEDEAYLRAIGFKQYWQDWPIAHPSHLLLSDLTEMLRAVGAEKLELEYVDPIWDSSHPSILPLSAPHHQHGYDFEKHGHKETVAFAKPVHRQLRLKAYVESGDGTSDRVRALEREIAALRSRRAVRLATDLRKFREADTVRRRVAAVTGAAKTLAGR